MPNRRVIMGLRSLRQPQISIDVVPMPQKPGFTIAAPTRRQMIAERPNSPVARAPFLKRFLGFFCRAAQKVTLPDPARLYPNAPLRPVSAAIRQKAALVWAHRLGWFLMSLA